MRYRLSRRETIVHGGTFIQAGSELPDGIFSQKQIDEHVRTGLLVPIGGDRDNDQADTGADKQLRVLKADIEDDGRALKTTDKLPTPGVPQKGKWIEDPKNLKGLSLQDLNQKVIEVDHNIEPFQTKEEAIAQLSMDFRS